MRFIPTTPDTVEALKKRAKKLQRNGGGKHADLLNRVAKDAGYDHWHHVTQCLLDGTHDKTVDALAAECRRIVSAAHEGMDKLIVTGPELLADPLILYACGGDAWLLEPSENLVSCLRFQNEEYPPSIGARNGQVVIAWDGEYVLDGQAFQVETGHPVVGGRTILGYDLEPLRKAIDQHQSALARMGELLAQPGAEALTEEVVERLVREGWDRERLYEYARQGLRYLPSRNSFVTAPISNFADEEV